MPQVRLSIAGGLSGVELKSLQRCLIFCVIFVFVYIIVLNESLGQRRQRFNSVISNASRISYPCQRKFWNTIYLVSGLGKAEAADAANEPTVKSGSKIEQVKQEKGVNTNNTILHMQTVRKGWKNIFTNTYQVNGQISSINGVVTQHQTPNYHVPSAPPDFETVLRKRASPGSNEIVLSIVDGTYADFALNFYETSILRFGIDNFLMVCLDGVAKSWLNRYNITCYYSPTYNFIIGHPGMSRGDFGTAGYYVKTNLKTLVTLHALNAGFSVLIVDLDIVFLKNPLAYLKCDDCDIQIQQDRVHLNSGFAYVRPTAASRAVYAMAWNKYQKYKKSHDQAYINMAVQILTETTKINIKRLSPTLFPCGAFYFTTPTMWRMFADEPCKECVIVHNNYIGSTAAKRYRFKENQLWNVDNNRYYSNRNAKYIIYGNPYFFGDSTGSMEKSALRSALAIGNITGRIVILPRFHCCDCQRGTCAESRQQCSLLTVLKLRTFDETFKENYRENSFLKHPKVPESLKSLTVTAKRITFLIKSAVYAQNRTGTRNPPSSNVVESFPKVPEHGASEEEISKWFKPYSNIPILVFHSLYGAFQNFTDSKVGAQFQSRISHGFACTTYDQWEVKDKW